MPSVNILRTLGVSFGVAATTLTTSVCADTLLNLRAVGPHYGDNLARVLAEKTHPQQLSQQLLSSPGITARQVINQICGSVHPSYLKVFLQKNKITADLLDVKGEMVRRLVWPQCLNVQLNVDKRVEVARSGDTYSSIYSRLIGSPGQEGTWAQFFSVSPKDLRSPLPQGRTVKYPYSTKEISVRPLYEESAFLRSLAAAAEKDKHPSLDSIVNILDPREGRLLVGIPSSSDGKPTCSPLSAPPFSEAAVREAYQHSARGATTAVANVMIVDNGFFGAVDEVENDGDDIFAGSPFPGKLFARVADANNRLALPVNIATYVEVGGRRYQMQSISPINFRDKGDPDEISGHGTHVTGLALGGPYFRGSWRNLRPGGEPWARVSIMNLGRGGESLVPNSLAEINRTLALLDIDGAIVNMSFTFEADANSIGTFKTTFSQSKKTLFVVAAGNDKRAMSQNDVPAILGGTIGENQITVAASQDGGLLAAFTNYGADYVDIAAPGCSMRSWLSNADREVALSGTSMAAPLVTFAASLVRSLKPRMSPAQVKARILASGDLLPSEDRSKVWSGSVLNVAKTLFVNDDYVEYGSARLIGTVEELPSQASTCDRGADVGANGLWAFKRDGGEAMIFHGKNLSMLRGICTTTNSRQGVIQFRPTHSIQSDGRIIKVLNSDPLRIPLADVREIVYRAK